MLMACMQLMPIGGRAEDALTLARQDMAEWKKKYELCEQARRDIQGTKMDLEVELGGSLDKSKMVHRIWSVVLKSVKAKA